VWRVKLSHPTPFPPLVTFLKVGLLAGWTLLLLGLLAEWNSSVFCGWEGEMRPALGSQHQWKKIWMDSCWISRYLYFTTPTFTVETVQGRAVDEAVLRLRGRQHLDDDLHRPLLRIRPAGQAVHLQVRELILTLNSEMFPLLTVLDGSGSLLGIRIQIRIQVSLLKYRFTWIRIYIRNIANNSRQLKGSN